MYGTRTALRTLSGSILLCALAQTASAQLVSCIDLDINTDLVPLGDYPILEVPDGQTITLGDGSDPIVDVRVAPPEMLAPDEQHLCGVDYFAMMRSGAVDLSFNRSGPYFIQLTHQSGAITRNAVAVGDARAHAAACVGGPTTSIPCKGGDKVIVSSTLGFNHTWGDIGCVVDGLASATQAICEAYEANGNMPVQIAIDAHGSAGHVTIGSERLTKMTIPAFVAASDGDTGLKGKISKMTIFACSAGAGNAGSMFVNCLAQALCTEVTAYTGTVWDTKSDTKWYTSGRPVVATSDTLGSTYCDTLDNSTGLGATIAAQGSDSIQDNDLTLIGHMAPVNQFGIFFYGPGQNQVAFGDGLICIGGGFFRLDVQNSGPDGTLFQKLDLSNPPQPSGQITAGSSWNFQGWFRDPFAGNSGFNLTNAVSIEFEP